MPKQINFGSIKVAAPAVDEEAVRSVKPEEAKGKKTNIIGMRSKQSLHNHGVLMLVTASWFTGKGQEIETIEYAVPTNSWLQDFRKEYFGREDDNVVTNAALAQDSQGFWHFISA